MSKPIYYSDEKTIITETSLREDRGDSWLLENGIEVSSTPNKDGKYLRTDYKRGYAFLDEKKYKAYIAHSRISRYVQVINQFLNQNDRMNIPEDKQDFIIKAYRKLERICGKQ